MEHTRDRLCDRGMAPHLLEPWFDVDRLDDLHRLARLMDQGTLTAPCTRQALENLGGFTARCA